MGYGKCPSWEMVGCLIMKGLQFYKDITVCIITVYLIYSMVINLSFLSYLSISITITVLCSFLTDDLVFFAENSMFFHLPPILD